MGLRNPGAGRPCCSRFPVGSEKLICLGAPGWGLTETRLQQMLLLLLGALFDVLGHVADRLQFFGVFIRDFDGKFFFKCHH